MSCPNDKHDLRAVLPRPSKAGDIVGAPPQTEEEPAWCRICGALWCKMPFDMGWGWSHAAEDRNAPTVLNILRKHMKGEEEKQLVQQLPAPEFDNFNIELLRIWMTGPNEDDYTATTVVDIGFFRHNPSLCGFLLAMAARSFANSAHNEFAFDEGLTLSKIQQVFNGELATPGHTLKDS